jgi:hypothetical protein
VTVPEEDAFVLGIGAVDGPDVSDSDFRSLLANLHGSLAVTDGAVSDWLKTYALITGVVDGKFLFHQ